MTTTGQTGTPAPVPGHGLPRWAKGALIAVAALAAVTLLVAVFAPRGRIATTATPTTTATSAATPSSAPGQTLVDGCLGGRDDLDQAVLTAQREAPLTEAGAAAFTATLMRWAGASPAPARQAETAKEVLAADATAAARLSGDIDAQGSTLSVEFPEGRYYLESITDTEAVVSWLAEGHVTDGAEAGDVWLGGSTHLSVVDGRWHYRDQTAMRSVDDMQQIGVPYAGGC
ncbi:hypothetical protein AB6N24_17510 [Cellulomonas sp. 179-A 4D5 NHS]|uniref:hypothetical protein n=1 Tax=Cellulomonas sp. 179-A 4D5 NHS TaxID=3142378 RepID=UPI0039A0AF35